MPITITEDLIDGADGEASFDGGLKYTRAFIVEGLTGPKSRRTHDALHSGTPLPGSVHPTVPTMACDNAKCMHITPTKAKIICTYGEAVSSLVVDAPPQLSIGSSVQNSKTNYNSAGELMFTEYTYPGDPEPTPQGGVAEIVTPQTILKYSGRRSTNPTGDALAFVGRVNVAGSIASVARTVMCTRIEGNTSDNGLTWNVEYEFQYNPKGWDVTIYFEDPETNAPPKDLVAGAGIKTYQVYDAVSFASLGL